MSGRGEHRWADGDEGGQAPVVLAPYTRIVFVMGSLGLAGALVTDSVAVAGRHLQIPLLGSVELVQAFVVIAASAAMLAATLSGDHASVRVLTERMSETWRGRFDRIAAMAGALLFAALAVGSAWIMWDLRDGAEETELLRIPLVWLRAFWLVSAMACCGMFAARALAVKRDRA